MRTLDWIVLVAWLIINVGYGLWRGRGSTTTSSYLLASKTMPWYAMGLSIMATQASAITFISTTSQGFLDGMRFVQYYFGLPLAMVILSATAVPIFHRAKVYTAYEYLEQRFDTKTRTLVGVIFLIQRGLGAGVALSAPVVVLSVILGWPDRATIVLMGGVVVLYTTMGGIKAVTWADVQQMGVIFAALFVALGTAIWLLPSNVSFGDAVRLAGAAGKLNAVTTQFDWNDRYTLWSGLIGGMFLALAYFGTDQSQVQRYLTGRSIGQSRLSLLFNAAAKVPMQFFILFIGTIVFVFFLFEKPPVLFHPAEQRRIERSPEYGAIEARYNQAFERRREAALRLKDATDESAQASGLTEFRAAQKEFDAARRDASQLVSPGFNDANYIFISYVTRYVPPGIVGLVIAMIFAAAMSTIAGEVNSLATVSVIDVYKRHFKKEASDRHYLVASRWATAFWGLYAVWFASFGTNLGTLIEVVNWVGSIFYGSMLGVFVLAFFVKRVGGTAAFAGVLVGQATILVIAKYSSIAFLWYNVIGCGVVVFSALAVSMFEGRRRTTLEAGS